MVKSLSDVDGFRMRKLFYFGNESRTFSVVLRFRRENRSTEAETGIILDNRKVMKTTLVLFILVQRTV